MDDTDTWAARQRTKSDPSRPAAATATPDFRHRFHRRQRLANYGTAVPETAMWTPTGLAVQRSGRSLTVNGTVTINGGANALANYGTLDADAISSTGTSLLMKRTAASPPIC